MKKKIFQIVEWAVVGIVVVFAIFCLSLSIVAKKSKTGSINFFGNEAYVVLTDSMEKDEETYGEISKYEIKSIKTKSMVFVNTVPEDKQEALEWYADIEVGDVLTFMYYDTTQKNITHRVIDIEQINGGYVFSLQGDNHKGAVPGTQIIDTTGKLTPYNYVIGKVTKQNYALGCFTSFVKSPVGMSLLIVVPSFTLFCYEITKFVLIINKDKKARKAIESKEKDEENKKQQEEIERLRAKLEELEGKNNT